MQYFVKFDGINGFIVEAANLGAAVAQAKKSAHAANAEAGDGFTVSGVNARETRSESYVLVLGGTDGRGESRATWRKAPN